MHQNVQCISNKILQIEVILVEYNVDVFLATEHWQSKEQISTLTVSNYTLQSFYSREVTSHGGTAIYLRKDLTNVKKRNVKDYCREGILECSSIELINCGIIIIVIYRPPTGNFNLFLKLFYELLNVTCKLKKRVVIGGDFNINFNVSNSNTSLLSDVLNSYGLKITITTPTRVTSTTSTCLDNFFIGQNVEKYTVNNINLHVSDHFTQILSIQLINYNETNGTTKSYSYGRKFNLENVLKFRNYLERENWNDVYQENNANLAFENFSNVVTYYFELSFPLMHFVNGKKKSNQEWITEDITNLRKDVCLFSDLAQKYVELKNYSKTLNSQYKHKLSLAKQRYFDQKVNESNNKTRTMWNIVKEIQGKSSTKKDIKVVENSIELDNMEMANNFNNHFTTSLTNNIKEKDSNFLNANVPLGNISFFLSPICEQDVLTLINKLKSSHSSGYDNISNNLLKKCKDIMCQPLSYLINLAFEQGVFPEKLKVSVVCPVYKKGDSNDYNNYRAITLLSSFSKLYESALNDQLTTFCLHNNIISSVQHGFVRNRDVNTALSNLNIQIVNALDKKSCPFGLFIDFSRAFDCVNHELLLDKLYRYGIRGPPLQFIKSYLSNRVQLVQINDVKSKTMKVTQGVPQGSNLGPLLYIIFSNDLVYFLKDIANLQTVCYADDTNFLITETSPVLAANLADEIYNKCILWSGKNGLLLNKEKTISVLFKQQHLQNSSEEDNINKLNLHSSAKILGVTFDSTLTWSTHIDNLCQKLRTCCYALRSLVNHCSQKIIIILYYANFHSQMRYGIINWGTSSHCQRVFILQKYALRIISNLPKRESCRTVFKKLNILTLTDTYIYEIGCFVYKNLAMFQKNQIDHQYTTRYKHNLIPDQHSTARYQKSLYFNGCKIFNALPTSIKESQNIGIFKKRLKLLLNSKNCYSLEDFFSSEF